MASTIKLKNGSGAPLASDLVQGEPALDLTNKRLYTENASGTVIEVGTNPSSLTTSSADINGGTIDGTVIGGSSAAAGSFTTISASGEIAANGGVAFGDNDKAVFGASDDLEIYHDGSNSWVADKGTGDLYVATNGHSLYLYDQANAKTMAQFVAGGASRLHYDNAIKLATTSTGIDVTGTVTADGLDVDTATALVADFNSTDTAPKITVSRNGTERAGIQANVSTSTVTALNTLDNYIIQTGSTTRLSIDSGGIDVTGTVTADGIALGDSDKATFGASDDLQIYHDGSNSYITDTGTGSLYYRSSNSLRLQVGDGASGWQNAFYAADNAQSILYYAGSAKLATTSTGVDVTGTVTADGLTVANTGVIAGDFDGGTAATYVRFQDDTDNFLIGSNNSLGNFLIKNETADALRLGIANNGDISFYDDTGSLQSLFWDASAESLGIGTSSPSAKLEISEATSGSSIISKFIRNTGASVGEGNFISVGNNAIQYGGEYATGGWAAVIKTNSTERARIDSSGNLLVGKSGAGTNTEGAQFDSNGRGNFTVDANFGLLVNRKTSDGELARFQKDGTTVGSIGVSAGDNFYVGAAAANHTGLQFSDNAIVPMVALSNSDNTTDLGASAVRFKNLYLSGGVYLGGTGAANLLDDYEEGTFTPTITFGGGNTGLSMLVNSGQYTKVGRLVYVRMSFRFDSKGSSTGNFLISGLPFTATVTAGGFAGQYLGVSGYVGFSGVSDNIVAVANESSTTASMTYGANSTTPFNDTNFGGTSGNYFTITGCYVTS